MNDLNNLTSTMIITYFFILVLYNNYHVINKSHTINVLSPLKEQ